MDPKEMPENNISEKMDDTFVTKSNDDIEPVASGSFVKVNGDHHISDKLFQNDDDTRSSTNSSSSHNLIIDQPEEVNLNVGGNESDGNIVKRMYQEKNSISSNINPLKRKHNTYENGCPEYKQPHLMNKPLSVKLSPPRRNIKSPTHNVMENRTDQNETRKNEKRLKGKAVIAENVQQRKGESEDHFQEYAKYLKLKPTVKYKCFKCYNNSFETLTQLRNHQKICLFKENHRHSSQDGNSFDANYSSNSNLSADNILAIPTSEQIQARLEKQYIDTKTTPKAKKKVFLCAACGTYYENWNLFLHMREVHRRHICLYCVGMFPTAERLTLHLEMKHDLEQNHFESHEKLLRASRDTCYLMCCICEHIFTEHEDFQDHNCSELIPPCTLCGQKGRHTSTCRLLNSERSSKDKSKRKNKLHKEVNLQGKKQDNLAPIVNTPMNENVRLPVDNFYDAKKTKADNINHWSFKVNGCVTEANVKGSENIAQPKEDIPNRKLLSPERSEPQIQPLNLSNSNNLVSNIQQNLNHNSGNITTLKGILSAEEVDRYTNHTNEDVQNGNIKTLENVSKIQIENEHPVIQETQSPNDSTRSSNNRDESSQNTAIHESGDLENNINVDIETPPNSAEITKKDEEQKLLFVPKFKIKIPKEYQTAIESEHSSTESDEEEQEHSVNGGDASDDENQQDLQKKDDEEGKNVENTVTEEHEPVESDNFSKSEIKDEDKSNMETTVLNESSNVNIPISSEEIQKEVPTDGILVASDDILAIELLLDRPIDKIPMIEFLRICLRSTYPICLYCNHARRIAVNGHSLALHMLEQHRFSATVDSITAEELQPATIVAKLKSFLPDLEDIFFNMETYCNTEKDSFYPYEKIFECFLCRFETKIHKELYLHNRKMHLKTAILCFMCRANFFSYSEILCHMCPGMPNKCVIFDIKFRCCLCDIDQIPSAFRLMVHLRKKHFACDVCLEDCQDQSKLSSHVWKHKLHHLCYRCGIAYRNKPDITKHLFWKHGTESVLCKRCLQKRWPHVYHFCIPPPSFVCEICNIAFSKAMFLKVHKRLHTGDAPYPCTEDNCDKKFISRRLLLKHVAQHTQETEMRAQEEIKKENEPKKDDEKIEEIHKEKISNEEETKKDIESSKKKRKKAKKEQAEDNIDDLMNLPPPNLSESDSSDDSNSGGDAKVKQELFSPHVPKVMLSPFSDNGDEERENNPAPIMDIWENFKTFQAKQNKHMKDEDESDTDIVLVTPILHVSQSDHDYCMMYKPITKEDIKDDDKLDISNESKTELSNTKIRTSTPKNKKQKSPRKGTKSGSDSSSSGSSSSSDSSCSCVSNCSCSSSSGSSSDSTSSSEDSDSSTSEGRKRIAAKRAAKEEKRNRSKSENSSKANTSDIVDVVTTDTKPSETINYNSIILETDLETDESETDEDFYDEHPQKLASQMLAEKRKQLMMQTCLSPSHNFDIVENSRPSTPSLPEEILKEKKVKIKKKKREKKGSKGGGTIPTFKLNIPNILAATVPTSLTSSESAKEIMPSKIDAVTVPSLPPPPPGSQTMKEISNLPQILPPQPLQQQITQNRTSTPVPAPIAPRNRLSTGSSSDADAPLKRSKRARRPNKFYGYSSDDDSTTPHLTGLAAFKPTPPPNLTWRKEDLPTPSKSITAKSGKSSASALKKSALSATNTPPLPPIPPIIIRPSGVLQSRTNSSATSVDHIISKPPPIIEPLRVPPVPVHHIQPQQYYPFNRESMESESSDEDRLHIPIPSKTQYNTHHNQRQQHQLQQHQQQQQQQFINPILAGLKQQQEQHQQSITTSNLPSTPLPISTIQTPKIPPALLPNPDLATLQYFQRNNIRWPIRPPAGARPPREGESVYCYCRCPYDEVSEMIACDGDDCMIEWFHFECVGIMVPPKGKWFCPECRPKYPHEMLEESYENT